MKELTARLTKWLLDLFEGEAAPGDVVYDPAQLAAVLVGCLAVFGVLYWLLWSLLVCEGGIFTKISPLFQVIFTAKTLKDFGYEGYPYQLGVFEGWVVNLAALVVTVSLVSVLWWVYRKTTPQNKAQ